MVVANLVGQEGSGFESDTNEVFVVTRESEPLHFGPSPKSEIAGYILDQIGSLRLALYGAANAKS
jgi:phosphopantothenoylcysteine decarboxylase/phosphopantothenate--cysteine ligase